MSAINLSSLTPLPKPMSDQNNKAEEAAKKALKEQDEMQARMTQMQSHAAMSKMVTDATNAMMAGAVDSGSKASNSVSEAAKKVNY